MPDLDKANSPKGAPKDAAAVKIFPPGVPIATVILGVVLNIIWPLGSTLLPPAPLRYWLGAVIIIAAIYYLGYRAISVMRDSGQSVNPYRKTTEILETGPYRMTRNPMYMQMVLVCVGFAVLLGNIWILLLTPVCGLLLHYLAILPEEAYLERKFGNDYLDYKRKVRRWI